MSQAERIGVSRSIRAFEAGFPVVIVFGMDEDGERTLAENLDAMLHLPPFVIIHLDGELLRAPIVAAIGQSDLLPEVTDFFLKRLSLRPPRDEDGVGVGFDEPESLGGGFEGIRLEAARLGIEASHVTGDDVVFVPLLGAQPGLPDGVLEIGTDGRKG